MSAEGSPRILIVEDESVIAMNTKLALISMGYEVLPIAISGETALNLIDKLQPDLVLMDIKLRGDMEGMETAGIIWERFRIPVLYVSAHTDEQTMENAARTTSFGYLQKPFNDEDLSAAIREALVRYRSQKN